MAEDTVAAVERLLCASVHKSDVLSGGDLSRVLRLAMADGRLVVAKGGPAPRVEAAMLGALAAAGVPVPAVLAVDDRVLVLSFVDAGEPPGGAWSDIGAHLRRLHAQTGAAYGWPDNYAFGPVAIANTPCDAWPAFWAERRLLPCAPYVAADLARRIERLCVTIGDLLPRRPAPALLHGDLWSGNILARGDRLAALVDPACCHGHAEVDLAMLHLFDRPSDAFYEAYGRPEPGHQTRRAVYTLWPVLVHLRLFGDAYAGRADRLLHRLGF